jgi:hypothetical protein
VVDIVEVTVADIVADIVEDIVEDIAVGTPKILKSPLTHSTPTEPPSPALSRAQPSPSIFPRH